MQEDILKPYTKWFKLFDRYLVQFSISRDKPRVWYDIDKSGSKHYRFISIEKVEFKDNTAYRVIVGPFVLVVAKLIWEIN